MCMQFCFISRRDNTLNYMRMMKGEFISAFENKCLFLF
jgi:hypothetical protein